MTPPWVWGPRAGPGLHAHSHDPHTEGETRASEVSDVSVEKQDTPPEAGREPGPQRVTEKSPVLPPPGGGRPSKAGDRQVLPPALCPAKAAHCVHVHACVHTVHVYYCVHICPCTRGCTRCTCQRVHVCPCTFWYVWVCRHACTQSMYVSVHMCMHMWARVCVCSVGACTHMVHVYTGTNKCSGLWTSARDPVSLSVRWCQAPTAALLLRRLLRKDECKATLAPARVWASTPAHPAGVPG